MAKGFTSHDVRRLHACSKCGRIGAYGSDLANKIDAPLVVKTGKRIYAHPRCLRVIELLLLSPEELGEVRIGDVDLKVLEAILEIMSGDKK